MIHLLDPKAYPRVRHLFEGIPYRVAPLATLAGVAPGCVYVDDLSFPQAAMLWDGSYHVYLVGNTHREAFVWAVPQVLAEEIIPAAREAGCALCILGYAPEDWAARMVGLTPWGKKLRNGVRLTYALENAPRGDWRERIPAEMRLEAVDARFLKRDDREHFEAITEWLRECWRSPEDYLRHGFGYGLVEGDTLVSWCLGEYVSRGACGLGIETAERYRNRGLGTIVASACAEHCLAHSLAAYWDSWEANAPSIAVAEKVGFVKVAEYGVFVGRYGE